MNSIDLQAKVFEKLAFDPSIDSANVGVIAENGVITLSGHVPSYVQKLAIERAVWRVKGVKAIAEEIEVRFPDDKKLADDEIAQRAVQILAWTASVPSDSLHITVHKGWVTLSGQVKWHYQRVAAATEVHKLSGVLGVVNNIALAPFDQPVDLRQRIVDALVRCPDIDAEQVHIVVVDGAVNIHGEVESWGDREAIEETVWSVPGVSVVKDHVLIC